MSYEVEMKFRVADPLALHEALIARGMKPEGPVEQSDTYFAHPARDFARTDEAFRIRTGGEENALTYKGPKHDGPTKTREEVEVPFAGGPDQRARMKRLIEALGFREVATIRKTRTSFEGADGPRPLTVVIDEAEGLGVFAEVETIAGDGDDLAHAQRDVMGLAEALGLVEVERRSYLRMHLEGRPTA